MRLMIVTDKDTDETNYMVSSLPNCSVYYCDCGTGKIQDNFYEDQKYFDGIYAVNPKFIVDKKVSIPYFYNILPELLDNELDFREFNTFYSRLKGASSVFVGDKKLSKYSEWAELESYWVSQGIDVAKTLYSPKKFFTPKLKIGYVYDGDIETYKLMLEVVLLKKSNWEFHFVLGNYDHEILGNLRELNGAVVFHNSRKEMYLEANIILDPRIPKKSKVCEFPSKLFLESLASGCVVVTSNLSGNQDNVLFDKVNYFKLDFVDTNTVISTLRYIDKRREKLERMSHKGRGLVKKYYSIHSSAAKKIAVMESLS